MCNEIDLTEKQFDILCYINNNGGFMVPVYPRVLNQNKNFYQRVHKLEKYELIDVIRYDGQPSDFTLTDKGKKYIESIMGNPSKAEKINDKDFLISLIESSSLSKELKCKVVKVLS